MVSLVFFFFNDTATTEIYTLSLHDALPIFVGLRLREELVDRRRAHLELLLELGIDPETPRRERSARRSEEHTSELQSRQYLVCRLLLEKKKKHRIIASSLPLRSRRISLSSA